METQRAYILVALVCALVCGVAIALGFVQVLADRSRTSAVRRQTALSTTTPRLLAAGIPLLFPAARLLQKQGHFEKLCIRIVRACRAKGWETNILAIGSLFVCVGVVCVALGGVQGSLPGGVALYAAVFVLVSAWAHTADDKQIDRMRNDLPDALRAMSSCFHAGFTLPQTFDQLQNETEGPLQAVFAQASQALAAGQGAHAVLQEMRQESGLPELAFVAVALEVQHESGGSMQHVLDATGDMLKNELALRRSLKVQTAQARLSARVVVAVTIGLVAVLMTLTEDFLGPFFASPTGFVLLGVAIGMQVLGIVLVRRMLNVQVG